MTSKGNSDLGTGKDKTRPAPPAGSGGTMTKSKTLAEEEAKAADRPDMLKKAAQSVTDRESQAAAKRDSLFQRGDDKYYIKRIQCLGDAVAIAPLVESNITEGGIHIPDGAQEVPDTGIVIGVGDRAIDTIGVAPVDLVGQRVVYSKRHQLTSLSHKIPYYGGMTIIVTRAVNVFVILGKVPHEIVDE